MSAETVLHDACVALFEGEPALRELFGYDPRDLHGAGALLGHVLAACVPAGAARQRLCEVACEVFQSDPQALESALGDLAATQARDIDTGGPGAVLHFAHGLHALLSYRVTHALWHDGRHSLALALKGQFTRALGVDILPQAQIGRGVWLDHGLGVVIGQTAVIEDDVSLWHGVTLGSNLVDRGATRHPRLREGVVVGAGAILLGGIEIGAGAVVAAGAVVTRSVEPGAVVSGPRAESRPRRPGGFQGFAPLAALGTHDPLA